MSRRKSLPDIHNKPIEFIFGDFRKQSGEVGIEIEVEGRGLPAIAGAWTVHRDGSLRGESLEYVLAQPVARDKVKKVLETFDAALKASGAVVNESYRTSVHVHLNMQGKMIKECYNVVLLYIILEDILTEFAGSTRIGNLFCLRARDAEFLLMQLRDCIVRENFGNLAHDNLRYSGINVTALSKYGSLEFRSLRGTVDIDLIQLWTKMLLQIKDKALTFENPREIVASISGMGPMAFFESVFDAEVLAELTKIVDIPSRIFAGARLAQDVAYASEWPKPDPKASATDIQEVLNKYTLAGGHWNIPPAMADFGVVRGRGGRFDNVVIDDVAPARPPRQAVPELFGERLDFVPHPDRVQRYNGGLLPAGTIYEFNGLVYYVSEDGLMARSFPFPGDVNEQLQYASCFMHHGMDLPPGVHDDEDDPDDFEREFNEDDEEHDDDL